MSEEQREATLAEIMRRLPVGFDGEKRLFHRAVIEYDDMITEIGRLTAALAKAEGERAEALGTADGYREACERLRERYHAIADHESVTHMADELTRLRAVAKEVMRWDWMGIRASMRRADVEGVDAVDSMIALCNGCGGAGPGKVG
jgi:hypothetical protein